MPKPSPDSAQRPVIVTIDGNGCTINAAGRKIRCNSSPIARSMSGNADVSTRYAGKACLVLGPSWQEYMWGIGLIALGLVIAVVTLAATRFTDQGLPYAGGGLLMLLGGAGWVAYTAWMGQRIYFDRRSGKMRAEPKGALRPRALSEIVAVQLNEGRTMAHSSFPHDRMVLTESQFFEVNLVIDDERGGAYSVDENTARELDFAGMAAVSQFLQENQQESRRINIACHSNLRAARRTAGELARFLDVPLADHTEC